MVSIFFNENEPIVCKPKEARYVFKKNGHFGIRKLGIKEISVLLWK